MTKARLETFSDGVIAILITIMVLELRVPHGADWQALMPRIPVFLFVYQWIAIGIYIFVALLWIIPDRRIESKVGGS